MSPPLAPPLIEHRDEIAGLCRAYGVECLEVFGSAADGSFDPARSDFDFIARFAPAPQGLAPRYFARADALERLLGRHVDLLTDQPIRNPYFRRAVDASRRTLYVSPGAEALPFALTLEQEAELDRRLMAHREALGKGIRLADMAARLGFRL